MQLDQRMKECYELPYRTSLPWRFPIIIRVDGKSFHTLTRKFKKPFDDNIDASMIFTMRHLFEEIPNVLFAYRQSDEISLLLYPWVNRDSQPWFNNEVQKMVSISSSIASVNFSKILSKLTGNDYTAYFDSRVFIIPKNEVVNYFIWRQQDAIRNSIQSLAQAIYSQKALNGKNVDELKSMIIQDGRDWENLPSSNKYGSAVYRHPNDGSIITDTNITVFKDDKLFIENLFPSQEATK